ncbi:ArnT family glycosyltransferase [Halolamina salina]|uniref:ArnT family glycosyltransferase n=1 Tax=Halolamina salina TaxID=1220023 RepID=A0ABD6B3A0_9EURY
MSGRPVADSSGATETLRTAVAAVRDRLDRGRVAILLLALVAAVASFLVATRIFPYHSINHDEGVYLQQAELLLSGKLFLRPPVEGSFRPWFFVESGRGLYSKYQPVPAAVFALGRVLGAYPIALAGISAGVVAGTAALARELFDWRVGAVAGVLVLASPLFLIHSGVYLPYAVTAAFELCFAVAYLRGERTGSRRLAAVAGAAIATAFFARPYTAVLFASPFILHAVGTLVRSGAWRTPFEAVSDEQRALFARRALTAGLGIVGVLVALGYNVIVTGDPLVFPYQAFAPHDGIGFGHREILGHEENYTLELGIESNRRVLARLFTEWVAMGLVGAVLAAAGVLATAGSAVLRRVPDASERASAALVGRRATVAGMFVSIAAGNVAFWGNFNILGALTVQEDGLIHSLGPYYHYDMLVPTAVYGAVAVVWGADRLGSLAAPRLPDTLTAPRVAVAVVIVAAGVAAPVAADAAERPLDHNAAVSEELAAAYEPFEAEGGLSMGNAALGGNQTDEKTLTFLTPVYGPWLNHPFQAVRNDPEFDGPSLYAIGDDDELDVAAAKPDHELRRYVMRGPWNPVDGESVTAELRPVERVSGESVRMDAAVGIPEGAQSVSIRAGGDAGQTYATANVSEGTLRLTLTVNGTGARLAGEGVRSPGSFDVEDRDELTVTVFVSTGPSTGFSYQLVFPIDAGGDEVRALSPTRERCPVPDRCVPAGLGSSPPGQFANATVESVSE